MKILLVSRRGDNEIIESDMVPRVGDGVDKFYRPFPKVKSVLWWPSETMLAESEVYGVSVDVLILCE